MKKITKTKLSLTTHTVRALSAAELGEIAGAQRPPKSISVCYCETDICPTNICF